MSFKHFLIEQGGPSVWVAGRPDNDTYDQSNVEDQMIFSSESKLVSYFAKLAMAQTAVEVSKRQIAKIKQARTIEALNISLDEANLETITKSDWWWHEIELDKALRKQA